MVNKLKLEAINDIPNIRDGFWVISGEMNMSRSNWLHFIG